MATPTRRKWAGYRRLTRFYSLTLLSGCILAVRPVGNLCAETLFEPRLAVTSVFIDNVDFVDSNEDSDYITEFKPGFRFDHLTRRLQVTADYDLQNLWYFERESLNRSYHQGRGDLAGQFLDGQFTLDAVARYDQQLQDFDGPVAEGNFGTDANRQETRTLGVIPAWHTRFGSWARGDLSYSLYDIAEEVDSQNYGINAALASGPNFARFQWQLGYRGTRVNYDNRSDAKYRDTTATLRYRLAADFFASTRFGVENNDYLSSPNADNPRGFHYQIGGGWSPNERTFLELRTGDRFFGRTYFLDARHQVRRLELVASYTEEATNSAAQQIGNLDTTTPTLDNAIESGDSENFIEQDAKLSVIYRGRINRLQLDFVDEDRDFQLTGRREQLRTLRLQINRRVNRQTTADLTIRREERRSDTQDSEDWTGVLKLERRLGHSLFCDLSYSRRSRDANFSVSEYRVNQMMVRFRIEP